MAHRPLFRSASGVAMFSAMCTHDHVPDGPCEIQPKGQPTLTIHPLGDPQHGDVEAFIRSVYVQRYGANVRQFTPTLVSLRDASGIVAAAGYRSAGEGPLFLERYFKVPIEWEVSTMTTGLRHMFLRLGITPMALGLADPDSLGSDADQWSH
jgi:hypothetical protein